MKKITSIILVAVLGLNMCAPVLATENPSSTEFASETNSTVILDLDAVLTTEDKDFLKKLETIFEYFELDKNGMLSLSLTESQLIQNFGFTNKELVKLYNTIDFQHQMANQEGKPPQTRIHVSNWKVYFTNGDVHATLFAAAQVGPAAIVAALSALGSVYPGVGTVIGAAVGVIGGGTIVYWVFQAVCLGKGLYIGVDWNGPFPNPAIGTW